MSEREWFFDFRYGPMMEQPIGEGLIEIMVDEMDFKLCLKRFTDAISTKSDRSGK